MQAQSTSCYSFHSAHRIYQRHTTNHVLTSTDQQNNLKMYSMYCTATFHHIGQQTHCSTATCSPHQSTPPHLTSCSSGAPASPSTSIDLCPALCLLGPTDEHNLNQCIILVMSCRSQDEVLLRTVLEQTTAKNQANPRGFRRHAITSSAFGASHWS